MPILFAILGERLGLEVTLSTAPLHVLVKYTHDDGATYNIEATSGAGFAQDDWYRKHMPMTEAAIANGVYLKTLSRREAYAVWRPHSSIICSRSVDTRKPSRWRT